MALTKMENGNHMLSNGFGVNLEPMIGDLYGSLRFASLVGCHLMNSNASRSNNRECPNNWGEDQ